MLTDAFRKGWGTDRIVFAGLLRLLLGFHPTFPYVCLHIALIFLRRALGYRRPGIGTPQAEGLSGAAGVDFPRSHS